MSIFFDFDVGPSGRRFRRAVSGDICDIELFLEKEYTDKLFGDVDIGSLIELSTLSICMINENKEVTGFMSLCDHPNVPGVDPDDWEVWIRNMYQKHFMSRNTLFIKFMCCKDSVRDVFLEEALRSVFRNDVYLTRIVLLVNSGCSSEHVSRYQSPKKWSMYRFYARRNDDSEVNPHYMHVALRQEYCPKLKIRRAVPEDNDDIVKILDKRCPRLKDMYGKYYISELLVDHPESSRKIIVAEYQERAVGVMCLNSDINYINLQHMYELRAYHGLMKTTSLEREQLKRSNNLLTTFGHPIMLGKFSPFDELSDSSDVKLVDNPPTASKEKLPRRSFVAKKQSKVYFKSKLVTKTEELSHVSDDYSDKLFLTATPSVLSTQSVALLLEEDPFDYEIINIDKSLLSLSEAFSCDLLGNTRESSSQSLQREPRLCRRKRKKSAGDVDRKVSDSQLYTGEPNAFLIELFGLHDSVDDKNSIDLLEAAFEVMKNYEYCIISVPSAEKTFSLLQHFTFVPRKPKVFSTDSLYVAHRCSVLGKLRVRRAELMDIPQIAMFMQNIECKDTLYTIEHSIMERDNHFTFIFLTGVTIIGVGILESPQELNFIRAKFNIDAFHNHKHHLVGEGAKTGFSSIKSILVYPVFEVHFRFFAREMMRLSGSTSLLWMTGYRNKMVAHKANGIAHTMVPLLPRKTDLDFAKISELLKFATMAKNMMPFSTWMLDKKLTSVPMVNVTTRIVILGASRTAMSFLNALLFGPTSTYLIFTNITLISSNGLPYMRQTNAIVEMMFPKFHNNTEKYLKSVPYTYYVDTVNGTLGEINKQEKYITITSGATFHYDLLFLLFGKQYQPPNYLQPLEEINNRCTSKKPYVRLDVPNYNVEPDVVNYDVPENVFIINHVEEANTALKYVKCLLTEGFDFQVIVYGATIHAYCCLTALLEMNVPSESIIFVDPFPPEDPDKTRVPVFFNAYVDQTVNEVLKNLRVQVYRSYYFQSWTTADNEVISVEFMSHFKVINLECSAFFYYGKRGVNTQAFLALNKCGMSYDGGILIDHQFRTKDPSIYAAGPVTSYYRRYYSQNRKQQYYDSYEVGQKLGTQIRNHLDPLFKDKSQKSVCVRFSLQDEILGEYRSCEESTSSSSRSSTRQICENSTQKVPNFVSPKVIYCKLPGGLQYLEVRSPGKKVPHFYVQSLHFNGVVMETFKTGYFKLHMTSDLVVDGITCLTFEKYSLEQFKNLYGMPSVVLNNVYLRYTTKKLDDFFNFFRAPWAYFLYHDQTDELFAMVKELLPKGQTSGDTLKEALRATGIFSNASLASKKAKMRKKLEASPHIAAVTSYVLEWLSEHDVLLPMYLQPTDVIEYVYDRERHPAFKKKRNSMSSLIMRGV